MMKTPHANPGKEILSTEKGLLKIFESGLAKVAFSVSKTYGPKGNNVAIEQEFGLPRFTKDGVSVAKEISSKNPGQNIAIEAIKNVAKNVSESSGDGTSTAVILSEHMFKQSVKSIENGSDFIHLSNGITWATQFAIECLKKMALPVKNDPSKLRQVATISSNNDPEVGKLIAEAFEKIPAEGIITVEEAQSVETSLEVVEGMQFDRGYISPYFVTNPEKQICQLDNAYVLVYDKKISSIQSILPILESVLQTNASLLIIAEDVDGQALASLILNRLRSGLKIVAVKAPYFGDTRKAVLEDIAVLTKGTFISEELGMKLENVDLKMLGQAGSVKVFRDKTIIVHGAGHKNDIQARCQEIKTRIQETTSDYEIEKLRERLSKLSGGIGVVKVGGQSEMIIKAKKDLVEDALQATRAAKEEGILPGGGAAAFRCSELLKEEEAKKLKENEPTDFILGMRAVRLALEEPMRCILNNGGYETSIIMENLRGKDTNDGFDALRGVYANMFDVGIIDPAKVLLNVLQEASAMVKTLISTKAAIVNIREENKDHSFNDDAMGMDPSGMGF